MINEHLDYRWYRPYFIRIEPKQKQKLKALRAMVLYHGSLLFRHVFTTHIMEVIKMRNAKQNKKAKFWGKVVKFIIYFMLIIYCPILLLPFLIIGLIKMKPKNK